MPRCHKPGALSSVVSGNALWIARRVDAIEGRRSLTDRIQEFIDYVDPAGNRCTRPDLAFVVLTNMVHAPFGFVARQRREGTRWRNGLTAVQLMVLGMAERAAADTIAAGMRAGKLRSAIKDDVRAVVRAIAGATRATLDADRRRHEEEAA